MLINFSRYLSTFLMIVICGSITQAQTATASRPLNHDSLPIVSLIQISEGEFKADGHIGPLHHFGSLFGHDPELRETFNRFNKSRIKQRRGNIAGSVIAGSGIVVGVALIASGGFGGTYWGIAIGLGGIGVGGTILLLNNGIDGSKKAHYKAELLSHTTEPLVHVQDKIPTLNLAFTENGIGLVYQF